MRFSPDISLIPIDPVSDDDSQACQDHHRLQNLGTIKIAMEWVQEIPAEEFIPPPSVPDFSLEPVHENVKKASVHCVGLVVQAWLSVFSTNSNRLGEGVPARRKHWYRTSRVTYLPTFEFVFSYAPAGAFSFLSLCVYSLIPF